MKQKSGLLLFMISAMIVGLLLLSSFFNVHSFRNTYKITAAGDNAIVAEEIASQLEYGLKYGKTLKNYYGIHSVFEELYSYCSYMDQAYIADLSGQVLYQYFEDGADAKTPGIPKNLKQHLDEAAGSGEYTSWIDAGKQNILLPIRSRNGAVTAALGMTYGTAALDGQISSYVNRIYRISVAAAVLGIFLFLFLFITPRRKKAARNLSRIMISSILISNVVFGLLSYGVFRDGYIEITRNTADILKTKIENDIGRIVSGGVPYGELFGIDRYFAAILERTGQIDSIGLVMAEEHGVPAPGGYLLPADVQGNQASLVMVQSSEYISAKLKGILINIAVSVITSLMIAVEVVIFLLAVFAGEREKGKSHQSIGIVRGLSFSFAMFQYMAMAFVSIVLASIYRPVVVLGREIPYDIVMGLPLSIQILTSILTAWFSGKLVGHYGWKPVAVSGILIMSAGTVVAACAAEPYLFLLSQVVIGLGLGLSKTAFDLYGVLAASEQDMVRYTSNANAGINVGFSCSAAIGAMIASSFGYSGAYLVMTVIGCGVAALVVVLGQNVVEMERSQKKVEVKKPVKAEFDGRFFTYLVFMVLPYFFITMFVDYFFPVYANAQGITTEMIGYVFLVYGICTSYLGGWICNILSRHFSCAVLMAAFLCLIGGGILAFSVRNILIFSIPLILLIAVADGIMPSQQFKYVYELPFSRKFGFTRAVSTEGIFSSSIRGIAPILFGYVMLKGNQGLMTVAVLVMVSAFVFALVNGICRRKEGTPDVPD